MLSTEDTAFSRRFLETYEWELTLTCTSFREKCAVYNCSFGYMEKQGTSHKKKRYVISTLYKEYKKIMSII